MSSSGLPTLVTMFSHSLVLTSRKATVVCICCIIEATVCRVTKKVSIAISRRSDQHGSSPSRPQENLQLKRSLCTQVRYSSNGPKEKQKRLYTRMPAAKLATPGGSWAAIVAENSQVCAQTQQHSHGDSYENRTITQERCTRDKLPTPWTWN